MTDLISREDAINAVAVAVLDDRDELEAIKAIPSVQVSGDLIRRQDAIEAVGKLLVDGQTAKVDGKFVPLHFALMNTLSALPSAEAEEHRIYKDGYNTGKAQASAEAEPTVIRSRTFMPTKYFKEWAKRIREINPNAVVIPCDAEVVSAEAEHLEPKPTHGRLIDADALKEKIRKEVYRHDYIEHVYQIIDNAPTVPVVDITQRELCEDISCTDCPFMKETCKLMDYVADAEAVQGWIPCSEKLPSESGWYVISVVGLKNITDVSYFYSDESKWSDVSHTQTVTAWMPLPTPYKGGDDE